MSSTSKKTKSSSKRTIFQLAILLLTIVILIPPIHALASNSDVLGNLNLIWLVGAFLSAMAANFFAGLVYVALCPVPLKLAPTIIVQVASGFTNRLLPGGLGGLGLNTFYMSKTARISKTEAATIAAANNLVGLIGFSLCLLLLSLGSESNYSLGQKRSLYWIAGSILGGVFVAGLLLAWFSPKIKKHIVGVLAQIKLTLRSLLKRPLRLVLALLSSIMITVCYVGAFWLAVNSAGISISLLDAMLAFAAGNAALAASPTPGGIGATELTLTAALRANSIEQSLALAVVLSFRLAAYWLPIIPGYIAFRYLDNKKLI